MSLRGEARSLSLGPASVAICYLGVEEALVIPALRLPRLDPPKNGGQEYIPIGARPEKTRVSPK